MKIDEELASFLQPGPFSVMVVTCDGDLVPETVRAWGQKLLDDGEAIDVFVGRESAGKCVENLSKNDAMAVAICNVTTYQAIQLKGRCSQVGQAEPEDQIRVRAHGEAFVGGLEMVGVGEQAARGVLVADVIRLRFVPEALFDQTPGPEAGAQR